MLSLFKIIILSGSLAAIAPAHATTATPQVPPAKASAPRQYPPIVLYSVSWCPHCKTAKEYFSKNSIPYTNKDVEKDSAAMQELKTKYKSAGVPVIVIGNEEKVLRGFDQGTFEKALKEVESK